MALEIKLFRYMERLSLSYEEAIRTPWSEVERAFFIWSLDSDRAKLDSERRNTR